MMMARKRFRKITPDDCLEIMEVRVVLYMDSEGDVWTAYDIIEPDPDRPIPLHEIRGALKEADDQIKADHVARIAEQGGG